MKILIPMAGAGRRFLEAGYKTPKPLIEVDGLPVVEHIVANFSPQDDFVFGVNEEHVKNFPVRETLSRLSPRGTIVPMPYQKAGPIGVVRNLLGHVQDEEPVIVNYCDFSWVWDYADFLRQVRESGCDGAIVCYRGFHPHLAGPNLYATLAAEGPWMREIREKHTWNGDKTKDWTSSGTYYFKRGSDVKKYFQKIEERPEWKIKGEFYVSQIFQLMKEDGLKIFIYEIPTMLQWGTPQDLEEYVFWSNTFRAEPSVDGITDWHAANGSAFPTTVLLLAAGAGRRFVDAGYRQPKPLIEVDGAPMVVQAARSLPKGNRYFVVTQRAYLRDGRLERAIRQLVAAPEILTVDRLTQGQAASALLVKERIAPGIPLLIGACDHGLRWDVEKFKALAAPDSGVDALIFTFRGNPAVRRNPQAYGWVAADASGLVTKVSVKTPLSANPLRDHAVVGAFWFRRAQDFVAAAEEMIRANARVNGEFYIDTAMNFLLASKRRVHVFEVARYFSWGTPNDLQTYEYWRRHFAEVRARLRARQCA